MRITDLLFDFHVPFSDSGHKHCKPGWINTECPFCTGNPGLHLGYNLQKNYFHCWRCGGKNTEKTLSKLLGIPLPQVKVLIREYGGRTKQKPQLNVRIRRKAFRLPTPIDKMENQHRVYLMKRGFVPSRLERDWKLLGTGPIAELDGKDYKHRIIAPIFWEGKMVSFQGRAISDRASLKYKACPKDRELILHQEILYIHPDHPGGVGICVEGITDVWRFGKIAFGVFGIDFTRPQVRAIAKRFNRVAVVFDDDPQAITQANKLVDELRFRRVDAFRVDIKGDPGAMKQTNADLLIKEVLG